eukprot:4619602-Pleurochrysis_carterae.AAC.1
MSSKYRRAMALSERSAHRRSSRRGARTRAEIQSSSTAQILSLVRASCFASGPAVADTPLPPLLLCALPAAALWRFLWALFAACCRRRAQTGAAHATELRGGRSAIAMRVCIIASAIRAAKSLPYRALHDFEEGNQLVRSGYNVRSAPQPVQHEGGRM